MRQHGDGTVCSIASRKKPFARESWAYIEFSTAKLIDLFKLQLYRWHMPNTHSSLGISDCLMLCHTGECQPKRNLSKHESSCLCHKPVIHHPCLPYTASILSIFHCLGKANSVLLLIFPVLRNIVLEVLLDVTNSVLELVLEIVGRAQVGVFN